jgi:hypothetical protein
MNAAAFIKRSRNENPYIKKTRALDSGTIQQDRPLPGGRAD